ncbi:hypothetical protein G7Y79_00032g067550 [Physcia stellaris]|nr:hypothetical protein G7Y79_00032g067550 [Physcia stellaris]
MRLRDFLPTMTLLAPPAIVHHSALTPWEQIHRTLHTYPLAIDFKNGPLFGAIFTADATANYTGPLSSLTGVDAIREVLLASVANLATQHQLGTTLIDIVSKSSVVANSTTYFTVNLVKVAPSGAVGAFTVLFGNYQDALVLTCEGWRIKRRQLNFMTPNLGNLTLG